MRGTGIGTSLLLIATGAVLAFAVHVTSTAIDLNTIGVVLMVVGLIGLLMSFLLAGEFADWFGGSSYRRRDVYVPPHEHTTVERDVIDEEPPVETERVRRIYH